MLESGIKVMGADTQASLFESVNNPIAGLFAASSAQFSFSPLRQAHPWSSDSSPRVRSASMRPFR